MWEVDGIVVRWSCIKLLFGDEGMVHQTKCAARSVDIVCIGIYSLL